MTTQTPAKEPKVKFKRVKVKPPAGCSPSWMVACYQMPTDRPDVIKPRLAGKWWAECFTVEFPGGSINADQYFDTPKQAVHSCIPEMKATEERHGVYRPPSPEQILAYFRKAKIHTKK